METACKKIVILQYWKFKNYNKMTENKLDLQSRPNLLCYYYI